MADKLSNNTGFGNKGCSNGNDSSLQKYLVSCRKYSRVQYFNNNNNNNNPGVIGIQSMEGFLFWYMEKFLIHK